MGMKKLEWTTDRMDEVYELRQHGKSLEDIVSYIFTKYGVEYSAARVSQVIKFYTESLKGPAN